MTTTPPPVPGTGVPVPFGSINGVVEGCKASWLDNARQPSKPALASPQPINTTTIVPAASSKGHTGRRARPPVFKAGGTKGGGGGGGVFASVCHGSAEAASFQVNSAELLTGAAGVLSSHTR